MRMMTANDVRPPHYSEKCVRDVASLQGAVGKATTTNSEMIIISLSYYFEAGI
jgi:hypothetical protein